MNAVLVTSLSAKNVERQSAALESWRLLGWPIVSLNPAEEVESIRTSFHGVQVEPVEKSAMQTVGRPLVLLDSVWEFARRRDIADHICLLNSDLLLRSADELRRAIDRPFDLLYGARLDVATPSDAAGTVFHGFDYFFLPRARAAEYPASPFCIGAPWWDYFVPLFAVHAGWNVLRLREPLFSHVVHDVAWGSELQAQLGLDFAQFLHDCWRSDRRARKPGTRDYRDIFAAYFFNRMLAIKNHRNSDLSPELERWLVEDVGQCYAPAAFGYLLTFEPSV